jgi:hypothetical protein
MSDTEKKYNDAEGHPRDIYEMIKFEPEWVAGRFLSIEQELKTYKQGAAHDSKIIHRLVYENDQFRTALMTISKINEMSAPAYDLVAWCQNIATEALSDGGRDD